MSKKMMLFGLCMVMACVLFLIDVEAKEHISYGAIGKGNSIPCGPKNRGNCKMAPPSNSHQRGCKREHRCRGHDEDKEDHENDEKEGDKNDDKEDHEKDDKEGGKNDDKEGDKN